METFLNSGIAKLHSCAKTLSIIKFKTYIISQWCQINEQEHKYITSVNLNI